MNNNEVVKKQIIRGNDGAVDTKADIDRISELPEPMIHQILSYLSCPKEVVRTSILSKEWKNILDSFLTFDFDQRLFPVKERIRRNRIIETDELQRKTFENYVEKSLASRLDPVSCIDKFRLYIINSDTIRLMSGRWIRAALEKNVKELTIHVKGHSTYIFPGEVLLSESITSLKFSGFELYSNAAVNLKNLRELWMEHTVLLGDSLIKKILESCPLLEDLKVVSCTFSSRLAIPSLVKLSRLEIRDCFGFVSVEIEAPNLEIFSYYPMYNCEIDLKGCGNLKNSTLGGRMTDDAFREFISMCPLLEKLVLKKCSRLERLAISSGNLKSLDIIKCKQLRVMDLDVPNLQSFHFCSKTIISHSLRLLPLCAYGLIRFFDNFEFKGYKAILHSKHLSNMAICEEPKEVFHYNCSFSKIDFVAPSTSVLKIVDNWLQECNGSSLTLISPSIQTLKLVHTMIIGRDSNPKCCAFHLKKCWRHNLIDVQIRKCQPSRNRCYRFKWRSTRF